MNSQARGLFRLRVLARRMLIWLGMPLGVMCLLVLLAPMIVSSTPVTNHLLARVNRSVEGVITVGDLSLGWTRGVSIDDLRFRDNKGLVELHCKGLRAQPTWPALLSGRLELGETLIEEPHLRIAATVQDKDPPPEEKMEGAAPSLPPEVASTWGLTELDLTIRNGTLDLSHNGTSRPLLNHINTHLTIPPESHPSLLTVAADIAGGGNLAAAVTVSRTAGSGLDLQTLEAEFKVDVNEVDLSVLSGLCELVEWQFEARGSAHGTAKGHYARGRIESLQVDWRGIDVEASSPAFKGDRLSSQSFTLSADMVRQSDLVEVPKLSLALDWLRASGQGRVPLTSKNQPNMASAEWTGQFEMDMVKLLTQMPNTLAFREGVTLDAGMTTGRLTLSQGRLMSEWGCDALAGRVGPQAVSLSEPIQLRAEMEIGADAWQIDTLAVRSSFTDLQVTRSEDQLTVAHWLDLGHMQKELGQFIDLASTTMQGTLWTNGRVLMADDRWGLEGTSVLEGLTLSAASAESVIEPKVDLSYAGEVDLRQRRIALSRLALDAPFGRMDLGGSQFEWRPQAIRIKGRAKDLDLARVWPLAQVLNPRVPPEVALAGQLSGDIECTLQAGVLDVTSADAEVRSWVLTRPQQAPFQQEWITLGVEAKMDLHSRRLNVPRLSLTSPQFRLTEARLLMEDLSEQSVVEGRADYEVDLDTLQGLLSSALPQGFQVAGLRSGHLTFSSRYPRGQHAELIPHASATGIFGFDRAAYQGLMFGSVDVNCVLTQGVMEIEPVAAPVNGGVLTFGGRLDFRETPVRLRSTVPIAAQDIQLSREVTESLLKYVNPLFANLSGVTGVATLACPTLVMPLDSNAVDQIELEATLSMDQVLLQGSPLLNTLLKGLNMETLRAQSLTVLPTQIRVQEGRVHYEDMPILIGDNPLNFSGTIGLDERIQMTVLLPYTRQFRTARADTPRSQRISLPLGGTLSNPIIDMRDLTRQLLQMGLRRGLEELLR